MSYHGVKTHKEHVCMLWNTLSNQPPLQRDCGWLPQGSGLFE